MESELRGDRKLTGTPIVLGNGEEWIVPSLPLNDEGMRIADMSEKLAQGKFETNREAMSGFFEFMFALLKANYPGLTEDAAKAAGLFNLGHLVQFNAAMLGRESKKA